MCWGKKKCWGVRRIIVHIEGLPSDSMFVRSRRGMSGWSQEAFLLADLGDSIAASNYYLAHLAGGTPERPEPWPRPGAAPVVAETPTINDLRSFFGGV